MAYLFASTGKYLETKLLDLIFSATAWTPPSTLYVAFFKENANFNTFRNLQQNILTDEITGGSYSRRPATWSYTIDGGLASAATNASDIVFTRSTAAWGNIQYVAVMDAATGGNILFWDRIDTAVSVVNSQDVKIAAGSLSVSLYTGTTINYGTNNIGVAGYSTYLRDKLLRLIFSGTAWTPPTPLYLGLFKPEGFPDVSRNILSGEISGNGYVRIEVAWIKVIGTGTNSVQAVARGLINEFSWNVFPANTGPWEQVKYCALFDASTGGNVLFYGQLENEKFIQESQYPASFAGGNLRVGFR